MRSILYISFFLLTFLTWKQSGAQTNVSGNISVNTTWDTSGTPYMVVGDVFVDTAVTLNIDFNTDIIFTGNYAIYVKGEVRTSGSTFKGEDLGPDLNVLWTGIRILPKGRIIANSARIQNAVVGIDYRDADNTAAIDIYATRFTNNICAVRTPRNGYAGIISLSLFENNIVGIDGSAFDNALDTTLSVDSTLMKYTNLDLCNLTIDTCIFQKNKIGVHHVKNIRRCGFYLNQMAVKITASIDSSIFLKNEYGAIFFYSDISHSVFYGNTNGVQLMEVKDTAVPYTYITSTSFQRNNIGLRLAPNARFGEMRCNYFDSNMIALSFPTYFFTPHDTGFTRGLIHENVFVNDRTSIYAAKEKPVAFSTSTFLDTIFVDMRQNYLTGSGIFFENNADTSMNFFFNDMHVAPGDSVKGHLVNGSGISLINYAINSRVQKTHAPSGRTYYEVTFQNYVIQHPYFTSQDTSFPKQWNTSFCYPGKFTPPPLGIKKTVSRTLEVFPNPTQGKIYLRGNMNMEKAAVLIFSVDGRKVYESTDPERENNTIVCDVQHLSPGIYYLRIQDTQGVASTKFIKE